MTLYMDFSAILAIATIITGLIWAIDSWFFKKERLAKWKKESKDTTLAEENEPEPKLVEYARSFFPILLIVFLLRSFVAEPFRIPSGSMKPTLLEGDFVLVNKFIYGLRMPIFGTEILKNKRPQVGDVFVFRFPKDTSIDFIKRVVAVPGDKISYKNKVLTVNGMPVAQTFIGRDLDKDISGLSWDVSHFSEKLGNVEHSIFVHPGNGLTMDEITVPAGHYFAMGDNRDNSEDSRVWGFVPEDLILGKATYIWFSMDFNHWDVRWHRIGRKIT